jgi:hypothetical protein
MTTLFAASTGAATVPAASADVTVAQAVRMPTAPPPPLLTAPLQRATAAFVGGTTPWRPSPALSQQAGSVGALFNSTVVAPQTHSHPPSATALQHLQSALPPDSSVQASMARMSGQQKALVGHVALLLLAQYESGKLDLATLRTALQWLLRNGSGLSVERPAVLDTKAGSLHPRGGTQPSVLPRLPDQKLIKILPALPLKKPGGPAQLDAPPARAHDGVPKPNEWPPGIDVWLTQFAESSEALKFRFWDPNDDDPLLYLLSNIEHANPQQLQAILSVLKSIYPELLKWLLNWDWFVNALVGHLEGVDPAHPVREIEPASAARLKALLQGHHGLQLSRTSSALGALLVHLFSANPDELGMLRQQLLRDDPGLLYELNRQAWFNDALSQGIDHQDTQWPGDDFGVVRGTNALLFGAGDGRDIREPIAALPHFDAGSRLHFAYVGDSDHGHRLYMVPGANATVDNKAVPRRLGPNDRAADELSDLAFDRPLGGRWPQTFDATVDDNGALQIYGATSLDAKVLKAAADATQRPVHQGSWYELPRQWMTSLWRTGFDFAVGHTDIVPRTAPQKQELLEARLLALTRLYGAEKVQPIIDAVLYRKALPLQSETPQDRANAHALRVNFMKVLGPDAKGLHVIKASNELASLWNLRVTGTQQEKHALMLYQTIYGFFEARLANGDYRADATEIREVLMHRYGEAPMREAEALLFQRSGAHSYWQVMELHLLRLLDIAAPAQRPGDWAH